MTHICTSYKNSNSLNDTYFCATTIIFLPLHFSFYYCDEHHDQKNLKRKGFIHFTILMSHVAKAVRTVT